MHWLKYYFLPDTLGILFQTAPEGESSLIYAFTVSYSDSYFVNCYNYLLLKMFEILEH